MKKLLFFSSIICLTQHVLSQLTTVTFDTTSSSIPYQTFVVPCTVNSITIEAQGASGGKITMANGTIIQGGKPALIKGTFNVTPGDTIKFRAAKPGINGFQNTSNQTNISNGGGGGGSWAINSNSGQVLVVAGGGGGASARTFHLHNYKMAETQQ